MTGHQSGGADDLHASDVALNRFLMSHRAYAWRFRNHVSALLVAPPHDLVSA